MSFDGFKALGSWGDAKRKLWYAARRSIAILPLICIAGWATASLDWHQVVDKLASFKIEFPTQPKYTERQMDTGAGRLTVHAYNLEEGPVSWAASWIEFPPDYVRSTGAVRMLEGAKEAFFKRFKGKFLQEKIVQLGAALGRDATFETEDDVRIRLRVFLRGNKLIQALAIAEPDMIDGPDAKRFFDSFKWE